MTQTIRELEQDIEESRARLDVTIDQIQDRLSMSGIVDEVIGSVRSGSQFGSLFDHALEVVKRNPVPVMLAAAGIGWLIYRVSEDTSPRLRGPVSRREPAADIPVLNTGNARVYDPDQSPRHPTHDALETRREVSARA